MFPKSYISNFLIYTKFSHIFFPFLGHRETGISYRREVCNCLYHTQPTKMDGIWVGRGKGTVKINLWKEKIIQGKETRKRNEKPAEMFG